MNKKSIFKNMEDTTRHAFGLIEDMYMGNFDKFKILTGYDDIDHLISGLHLGDLITIVGGASSGKTSFLANIAINVAMRSGQEVVFVGLQHLPEHIWLRLLAGESNVIMRDIIRGYMRREEWHEMTSKAYSLSRGPLSIAEAPVRYMPQLLDELRKLKQEKPDLKMLIVDSLEMLPIHSGREYAEAFRQLKLAALELRLPVLISCSLVTKKRKKANKTVVRDPKLQVIKRYSDTIMLLDSDITDFVIDFSYYPGAFKVDCDMEDRLITKIKTEISLLKNPYGPTGSIFLNFIPQQYRFESIATK